MLKGISTHVTCVRSHLLFLLHSRVTGAHTNSNLSPQVMCIESFYDKSNLKKHKHLHSTERPFFCKLCNKSYSDQSKLKKHQCTHRDDGIRNRPYSCGVYKKRFFGSVK
jgi:uncharacterized Zn-finger protein